MKEREEIIKIHSKSKFVDKTSLNINIFDNVLVKHKDDRMKWKYMKVEITRAPYLEKNIHRLNLINIFITNENDDRV